MKISTTINSLIITILLSVLFIPSLASTTTGTIQRTIKQQIIASIPPSPEQASIPVLTSPSGKYTAIFRRSATSPVAGGFGNDFCYVEVEDTATGESMWETECAPVSNINTCALVLSDDGLEVYDGSNSAWNTDFDTDDHVQILELVDEGDMRMRDQNGELVWKASDEPRVNQKCGLPGSPGLASGLPPFAAPFNGGTTDNPFGQPIQSNPIQGGSNISPFAQSPVGSPIPEGGAATASDISPFAQPPDAGAGLGGQQQSLGQQQQQPFGNYQQQQGQAGNAYGQPLVDNTPFDSGKDVVVVNMFLLSLSLVLSVVVSAW